LNIGEYIWQHQQRDQKDHQVQEDKQALKVPKADKVLKVHEAIEANRENQEVQVRKVQPEPRANVVSAENLEVLEHKVLKVIPVQLVLWVLQAQA
jgi:hypothetical protein